MSASAFEFDEKSFELKVLDQTLLPNQVNYVKINSTTDAFEAIKAMLVRGAPCIAAVACLSIVSELSRSSEIVTTPEELDKWLSVKRDYLVSSRPTAVNLRQALDRLVDFPRDESSNVETLIKNITNFCLRAIKIGTRANRVLGDLGAAEVINGISDKLAQVSILTHCNTGALATTGYGTALGVIRSLHAIGKLKRAYCTETRPYNQGSRLTAWELVTEHIPATLIADNMVAYKMATEQIDAVIVGADRVAINGDTANKIGTLQIAIVANHYRVPFYVAAPSQSIDRTIKNADSIVIEQRPADELRKLGSIQLAPEMIDVWNPSFDITPAHLITGIISEYGVCKPANLEHFLKGISNEDDALF